MIRPWRRPSAPMDLMDPWEAARHGRTMGTIRHAIGRLDRTHWEHL